MYSQALGGLLPECHEQSQKDIEDIKSNRGHYPDKRRRQRYFRDEGGFHKTGYLIKSCTSKPSSAEGEGNLNMDLNLKNRKVIITGAGDGIGRALGLAFAKEGAKVAVCARSQDRLDSLSDEIEGTGHLFFSADLGTEKGVEAFYESVMKQPGQVDVLINNVGAILKLANFFELTDQDWEASFQINLMSAVRLSRYCIPSLKQSNCARIINISSIAAAGPQEVFPHYSAMKAGLSNLTVSLAQTLAADKILVNSICPGPVWSKSWENEARAQSNESNLEQVKKEIVEQTKKTIPLKRMGTPEDLTGLALFLASDQAGWITATSFNVDGGITRNPF